MMTSALFAALQDTVTNHFVVDEEDACALYGADASGMHATPGAVILPANHEEAARVLALLHGESIPTTFRGAGNGAVGSAVPEQDGAVVSFARMDQPIVIDRSARMVTAPAGARLIDIARAASSEGLQFGTPLTAFGLETFGGLIATGGDRIGSSLAEIPGRMIEVRGLTIDGETIIAQWGATAGDSAILDLITGSDGTLAAITSATMLLDPVMPCNRIIKVVFADPVSAAEAAAGLFKAGVSPTAADVIDRVSWPGHSPWPGGDDTHGLLLVWLSGVEREVSSDADWITTVCNDFLPVSLDTCEPDSDSALVDGWRDAVRNSLPGLHHIPLDYAVPVSAMPELLGVIHKASRNNGVPVRGVARFVPGVFSMHIPVTPLEVSSWSAAQKALREISERSEEVEGMDCSLLGHGRKRLNHLRGKCGESTLEATRGLRETFDPAGILCPDVAPNRLPDRRDQAKRQRIERFVVRLQVALDDRISATHDDEGPVQISDISGAIVLAQVMRTARTHAVPISLHDQPPGRPMDVSLTAMKEITFFYPDDRVLIAEAGVTIAEIQKTAQEARLWWPVNPLIPQDELLSEVLAWERLPGLGLNGLPAQTAVDGCEAVTGRGEIISAGGIVAVQRGGLRLMETILGSRHRYAVLTSAALVLEPLPPASITVQGQSTILDNMLDAAHRMRESVTCMPRGLWLRGAAGTEPWTLAVGFCGQTGNVEHRSACARAVLETAGCADPNALLGESGIPVPAKFSELYALRHQYDWTDDLHMVVWGNGATLPDLVRKLDRTGEERRWDWRLLVDFIRGRIDVHIVGGRVSPRIFADVMKSDVASGRCRIETWSSALAGTWESARDANTDELARKVKESLDPNNLLPPGWNGRIIRPEGFSGHAT
jgi:FAD/FMN-containing dehydrogenase